MKSSRFILTSDFATTKNDAEGELTLLIPEEVIVYNGKANIVKSSEIELGSSKNAGMRYYLTSTSEYAKDAIASSYFTIDMPIDDYDPQYGHNYYQGEVYGSIYRVSGNKVRMEVTFPAGYSEAAGGYTRYYGRNQILTLHVQTFIDPFDI